MKSTICSVAISLALAACSSQIETIEPGPDGYRAIRFLHSVQVQDSSINTFRFSPGTVLVADREVSPGRAAYCGTAFVNNGVSEVCIGIAPDAVVIGVGRRTEVVRAVPSGSYEIFQIEAGGVRGTAR